MAFREKSAWVMAALMFAAGLYYLNVVVAWSRSLGEVAPPTPVLVGYVVLVVIGSVVAQATLGISSPREATAPADERERPLLDRAGNLSGLVLGFGAITSLLHFLAHENAYLLFHSIMGSLILSQIAEYVLQIVLLRRSA